MENMYTLSSLANFFIQKYEIKNTKNNFKALRIKIVRTLEKLGLYEELKKTSIANNSEIKVSNLNAHNIEQSMISYLIKHSTLDEKTKKDYIKYVNEYIESIDHYEDYLNEMDNLTQEEINEKEIEDSIFKAEKISQKEIDSTMLRALFNIFFSEIDVEKWQDDKQKLHLIFNFTEYDEIDPQVIDIDTFKTLERYNNPHLSYCKLRDRPLL